MMTTTLTAPATGGTVVAASATDLGGYPVVTIDATTAGALRWRVRTSTGSFKMELAEEYSDLAATFASIGAVMSIDPALALQAGNLLADPAMSAVLVHRHGGLRRGTVRVEVVR